MQTFVFIKVFVFLLKNHKNLFCAYLVNDTFLPTALSGKNMLMRKSFDSVYNNVHKGKY